MPPISSASWARSALVVVAALVALSPGVAAGPPRAVLAGGVGLAACTLVAARQPGPAPWRSVVALDTVYLVLAAGSFLAVPPALTTVLLGVLPLAALVSLGRVRGRSTGRPAVPWLQWGRRLRRPEILLVLAGVLVAATGLVLWAAIAQPAPPAYFRVLAAYPPWLAGLGVVAFALVNSVWEEVLFRGAVLQDLVECLGPRIAVVAQAGLFGAAHWAGFPSGWAGVAMAGAWGLLLGILRLRTGGLGTPYLVHVLADATIGLLAVGLLTR